MKVAFAVVAVFSAFVVYLSAQKEASGDSLDEYKKMRHFIFSSAQVKKTQKVLSWKNRKTCLPDDLAMVPQRLLDWFHVLKSNSPNKNSKLISNGCSSPALIWFFNEFDTNKNMELCESELNEIESIPYEHCLKQFFKRCDVNRNKKLSLPEICRCFQVEPPCTQAEKNYNDMIGEFKPQCDEDGFYAPRQCHEASCWCVDRFNTRIEGSDGSECRDNTDPNEVLFTGEAEDYENTK